MNKKKDIVKTVHAQAKMILNQMSFVAQNVKSALLVASAHVGAQTKGFYSHTQTWATSQFKRVSSLTKTQWLLGLSCSFLFFVSMSKMATDYKVAYQIQVDGTPVAIVETDAQLPQTIATVEEEVSAAIGDSYSLQKEVTASVGVYPQAEVVKEDVLKEQLLDQVEEVKRSFVLSVDEVMVGTSMSQDELTQVIKTFIAPFINQDTTDLVFKDTVGIVEEHVLSTESTTTEEILDTLAQTIQKYDTYMVEKEDTLASILQATNMQETQLNELNPETEWDSLQEGTKLNIVKEVPLLEVETIDDTVLVEVIESPIRYVEDSNLYEGQQKTVTAGTAGSKSIHALITKVNGVEVEREVLHETVTVEATETVIAKGTKKKPVTASTGRYIYPVSGRVTSSFGWRTLYGQPNYHTGIDFSAATGTSVKAADGGKVVFAGWDPIAGNLVTILHDNGSKTLYAHNSSIKVSVGQRVAQGQVIALSGSTGLSTGPHVHFEIQINGTPVNPANYLS
ncbi:MAG: peptidoglycan DD-metalloendopeptidase family protein [Erysipelotrichaceae bacterium]